MITIDYKDRRPLYQQIMEKIEDLATQGLLKPDEQLPSVRNLAMELSINPNTIQRAYSELEKMGITYTVSGKGSFLAKTTDSLIKEKQGEVWQRLKELVLLGYQLQITQAQFLDAATKFYQEIRPEQQGGILR